MIRWLPSTGFFLTLVLLWLALNNTLAPGHIVMAILVGIVVPWVVRPMFTDENAPEPLRNSRRYLFAAWLGLRLLRDIVSANLVVASKILFAREASLSPTLVSVDLRLQSPTAAAVLAGVVTLTPGTLSADVLPGTGSARYRLLVHALDAPDPEALITEVRERYENLLLEIVR